MTLSQHIENAGALRHRREYPEGHRGVFCYVASCPDAHPEIKPRESARWLRSIRAQDRTGAILYR